jgi:hypothetical protein
VLGDPEVRSLVTGHKPDLELGRLIPLARSRTLTAGRSMQVPTAGTVGIVVALAAPRNPRARSLPNRA